MDATLAALAELPDDVREGAHLAFVTHSIPTAMNDGQRPRAAGRTSRSTAASAAGVVERVRRRPAAGTGHELVFCSRSGSPARPWLEPDINDHLRSLHADIGAAAAFDAVVARELVDREQVAGVEHHALGVFVRRLPA